MPTFLSPLIGRSPQPYSLRNTRSRLTVADRLLTAFDAAGRRTGLLKHKTLADGSAMIIAPTTAIHTFFMKFAIDVAFVARDGRVVKTYTALAPWRMAAAFRAHAVVELPAGALARSRTSVGDILEVVEG